MKLIFIALFIACFSAISFAQTKPAKKKAQNYYFYKAGAEISQPDSADVIEVITEPDSGSNLYPLNRYNNNKKLYFSGFSSTVHPVTLEGQGVAYFPNGKRRLVASHDKGNISGDAYFYYPNGNLYKVLNFFKADTLDAKKHKISFLDSTFVLANDTSGTKTLSEGNGYYQDYGPDFKQVIEEGNVKDYKRDGEWKGFEHENGLRFIEHYKNGKLIDGVSTDKKGGRYTYSKRLVRAEYPGGINAFGMMLGRNVMYPKEARENGITGKPVIQFSIDADGNASGFKVATPVDPLLDNEALRAVRTATKWKPALLFGKPVRTYYIVPVSFTLGAP